MTYAIDNHDSVLAAAGKIFQVEFQRIETAAWGVINRADTEPLHDLRISIRRARSALKFFAKFLTQPGADQLGAQLAEVNRALGPARDFDAWLEYLQSNKIRQRLAGNAAYEAYVAALQQERTERLPELCFLLNANYNQALKSQLNTFIAADLDISPTQDRSPGFLNFSNQRIFKQCLKIADYPELDPSSEEELLHDVRKTCRKIRYWAEFSQTEDRPTILALAKYFKGLATSLGTTRDMQVHVSEFASSTLTIPDELITWHQEMEQKAWKKYRKLWRTLISNDYLENIKQALTDGS